MPILNKYEGWALFCDCDVIFLNPLEELFSKADDKYAIMCVQHDYTPKEGLKMDGKVQSLYPRKNWSSVVLWNCAHPSNKKITLDLVNNPETTGKFLHRFSWLNDSEIGSISHEWNWLLIGIPSQMTENQRQFITLKVDHGLKITASVVIMKFGKKSK